MRLLLFFVVVLFVFSPLFAEDPTVAIDQLQQKTSYFEEFVNMLITLGFLLAFAIGILYFVKKLMRNRLRTINRSTAIKILERRALNQKTSLYLIDVLGKGIVISESQGVIALITEFPPGTDIISLLEEENAAEPPGPSFKDGIQQKLARFFSNDKR